MSATEPVPSVVELAAATAVSPDLAAIHPSSARWWVAGLMIVMALGYLALSMWLVTRAGDVSSQLYLPILPMSLFMLIAVGAWLSKCLRISEVVIAGIMLLTAHGVGTMSPTQRWIQLLLAKPLLASEQSYAKLTDKVPAALSVAVPPASHFGQSDGDEVRLLKGLSNGGNEWSTLPYSTIIGPALNSLPLMFGFLILATAMIAITARQWNQHERLQQPLAQITSAFASGSVFTHKAFWWAAAGALLIWAWNVAKIYGWNPLPSINLAVTVKELPALLGMTQTGYAKAVMEKEWSTIQIDVLVVGVTFLLSTEMSFSIWGAFWGALLICGLLTTAGIPVDFNAQGRDVGNGAMLAMALVIGWLGRHHYWALAKAAVGIGCVPDDRVGVWGMRIFVGGSLALGGWIALLSGSWVAGVLGVVVPLALCLVVARVIAEAGLVAFQIPNQIVTTFASLGLPLALPFQALFLAQWLTSSVMIDSRNLYSGHLSHVSGLAERQRLSGRWWLVITAVAMTAAVVGLAAALYSAWTAPASAMSFHPRSLVNADVRTLGTGTWGDVGGKLLSHPILWGLALVAGIVAMRRVWSGFPLNPLAVCVAFSFPIFAVWGSILIGWLAKMLTLRLGGSQLYTRLKPVAFGLIAGDIAGRCIEYILKTVAVLMHWKVGQL